ncbi:Hypothetical protein, putative [Bodo saltans]|uniref:Uncharacterized protein n=1 Tax=Bodo saltans TaxID=75058 RepID=A0A0S4INN3_BODSA|nr:Hypothetical protein, putative [Bodo saltans]|eukprot:CUF69445.1 Hypothetical protein, putative [Bodo saltans]
MAAASERSSCALRAVDDAVSALNACLQDRTAKRCDDMQIDVFLHRSRRRRAARVMENEQFTARMAAAVAAHNPAQPPQGRGAFSSSDDDGSSGSDGMKRKRRTAKAKREVVSSEWEATDTFHILCVRVGRVLALRRCIAYMYRQQQTNYYQHTFSPQLSSDSDPQLAEEWLRALFHAETRLAMSVIQLTRGGNALREFLHESAPLPPKTELATRASTSPEDAGRNGSQQPITVHEEREHSHNSYRGRERSEASTHRSHNSNDDDAADIEEIDYLDS